MNPQRLQSIILGLIVFALVVGAPYYVSRTDKYDTCVNDRRLLYIDGDKQWFHGLRRAEQLHTRGALYYHLRDVTYHNRQINLNEVDAKKC